MPTGRSAFMGRRSSRPTLRLQNIHLGGKDMMVKSSAGPHPDRRAFLVASAALGALAASPLTLRRALAQGLTITLADIGVGDPGGDWSAFEKATGHKVNLVSMGNAPSAVLNQLIAGGGRTAFDIINIVGGMQEPLLENDLIMEIDTSRLPNWEKNTYIMEYLAPGSPGFEFIG